MQEITKVKKQPRLESVANLLNEALRDRRTNLDDVDSDRSQRILIKAQGCIFYLSTHEIEFDSPDWTHSICIDADSAPVLCEESISATKFPEIGERWLEECSHGRRLFALLNNGTVPTWVDHNTIFNSNTQENFPKEEIASDEKGEVDATENEELNTFKGHWHLEKLSPDEVRRFRIRAKNWMIDLSLIEAELTSADQAVTSMLAARPKKTPYEMSQEEIEVAEAKFKRQRHFRALYDCLITFFLSKTYENIARREFGSDFDKDMIY